MAASGSVVLVECLHGEPARDATTNRLVKTCVIIDAVSERVARRAAQLRRMAGQGSAVDAFAAFAEPAGMVLTGDRADLEALAARDAR